MVESVVKSSAFRSALRSAGTVLGREITRSIFGTSRSGPGFAGAVTLSQVQEPAPQPASHSSVPGFAGSAEGRGVRG